MTSHRPARRRGSPGGVTWTQGGDLPGLEETVRRYTVKAEACTESALAEVEALDRDRPQPGFCSGDGPGAPSQSSEL